MLILGVHSGHDGGAVLVRDGEVLAAVSEERNTRNKLSFGAPYNSIQEVLRIANVEPNDVDAIAFETIAKHNPLTAHALPWLYKVLLTNGRGLLDFIYIKDKKLKSLYGAFAVPFNLLAMTGLPRFLVTDFACYLYLRKIFGAIKIEFVSHHLSHLASAYYMSGFREALSVVIEEYDGRDALKIDLIQDGVITPVTASPYPHSPGVFYSLITRMLGFNQLLHAGKVTGLAAYADPSIAAPAVNPLMWNEGLSLKVSPLVYSLVVEYASRKKIPGYFQAFNEKQLAASFQKRLEDVLCSIVQLALQQTGVKNLVLSGGVAANVKLNQRLFQLHGVEQVFVQPAMSDCGVALGAALLVDQKYTPAPSKKLKSVLWGTDITNAEKSLEDAGLLFTKPASIHQSAAEKLAEGNIVVRVAGRMEFGPRALGNRSILYHCNDTSINEWLNKRLRRTEFMPFAPVVLLEDMERCFLNFKGAEHTAEFMTITFDCTEWMKQHCPAVVHLDGTARPQIVHEGNYPELYQILKHYKHLTGVPVLINTSYNIHNEPIVRTAEDAISIFKKTCLDYLVLDTCLVSAADNGLRWNEVCAA